MDVAKRMLAIACLPLAHCAQAAWVDDAALALRFDDNLSRGQLSRDIKGDTALVANVSKGTAYYAGGSDRLALSFKLSASAYRHYGGLDNVTAGLELAYGHKFGLGPYAPDLRLAAMATRLEYRDAQRDGWLYSGELALAKRLSPQLSMRLAYLYEQRTQDHVADRLRPSIPADVFNVAGQSLRIGGEYAFDGDYVVSAAYALRRGDVVSTTLRNRPVFLASDAISEDDVFGSRRFAYRMQAWTRSASVGVSRLFGDGASLTLGYEHHDSQAGGGVDYQSNLVSVTYLRQY